MLILYVFKDHNLFKDA